VTAEPRSLWQSIRRWRLQRAELRLADAECHLRRFGFANLPSEDYREQKRIEKLRRKVAALGGNDG